VEHAWSYQRASIFDFWEDFKQHQKSKRESDPREERNESESERNIRIAFQNSWWDHRWWKTFIVLPLAKEYGTIREIEDLCIDEAFAYRESNSSRNEFEEYYYWLSDKNREEKSEGASKDGDYKPKKRGKFDAIYDKNRKMQAKPSEKNKKRVEQAMRSNKDYLQFMMERGFQ
jgi:hypothetical protein